MNEGSTFRNTKWSISLWLVLCCFVNHSFSSPIGSVVPHTHTNPSGSGSVSIPHYPGHVAVPDIGNLHNVAVPDPSSIWQAQSYSIPHNQEIVPVHGYHPELFPPSPQLKPVPANNHLRWYQYPQTGWVAPPNSALNQNGLYKPRVLTIDESRNQISNHEQLSKSTGTTDILSLKAETVPAGQIFSEMKNTPIVMDLLTSQFGFNKMNPQQREIIQSGGQAFFRLLKISEDQRYFYALQMIDDANINVLTDVEAYWLPANVDQVKPLEIPLVPGDNDPKYVFTAPFSGCSITADYIPHNGKLHLRHVYANHENEQYNHNNVPHSAGMVDSMSYKDYGIMNTPKGNIDIGRGFALLHFSSTLNQWVLRYQGIVLMPFLTELRGSKVKASFPSGTTVSNVGTKILDSSDKRQPPVATLPITDSQTIHVKDLKKKLNIS